MALKMPAIGILDTFGGIHFSINVNEMIELNDISVLEGLEYLLHI